MNKKENFFEKFVYLFAPIFIYFVIDLVVELLTMAVYVIVFHFDITQITSNSSYLTVVTPVVKVFVTIIFTLWFIKDAKTDKVRTVWAEQIVVKKVTYLMIILSSLPFCIFFNLFVNYINLTSVDEAYQKASASIYGGPIWLTIISTIILAPLAEELVVRGFIFKRLRVSYNFYIAAIVSALIFALMHGNMTQGIYAFCIGFYFCFVYEKTKTIKWSVILHMFFNMWGVLWTYTGIFNVLAASKNIMLISIIVAAIIGIALIYLIARSFRNYKD